MTTLTKKKKVALVGTALVLVTGGAAFAYWTAGGSGTGTATTGTSTAITAVQTSTVSNLRPGGAAQSLNGDFDNPTGNGPVYVTSVTAAISSVTGGDGACDATDYTLATPVMLVGAEVAEGDSQGAWTGATLAFNNKATNQDGCKNATVNLTYTVN